MTTLTPSSPNKYNVGLSGKRTFADCFVVPDEREFKCAKLVHPTVIRIQRGENNVPKDIENWSKEKQAWWWTVHRTPWQLERCPEHLRNSYDIVIEAVKQDPLMLAYASEDPDGVRNVSEIVLVAVKKNGMALQHASEIECGIRNDMNVALAAVSQNGFALQFVQRSALDTFPCITLAAIKQNGLAIQFAPNRMRANPRVQEIARRQNWRAIDFFIKS